MWFVRDALFVDILYYINVLEKEVSTKPRGLVE
jgi:hypothetical protein